MAYNLQSLITILQQILNPQQAHLYVSNNRPQLESLLQKSVYLKQILENSSGTKLESLGSQIRDAAHTAEDIIECHMLDLWRTGADLSSPELDLQQVMEEIDSAIKQAVEIVEDKTKMSSSAAASLLPDHTSSKSAVVGVDEALLQLKDVLTRQVSKLEIVPIVGMGGIGKTTLAQQLYQDQLIAFHFDVLAWTTISQDYNVREVVLGLLRRPNEKLSNELTECTDDVSLKEILRKRLFGKRYLVVLDDMWSTDSWDALRNYFPDNNNGSRIILTTRDSNLARCIGKQNLQHEVQLMNKSQSWDLLDKIVFGEEKCPGALQEIGRSIASDCRGLPLAINVMGGILSKAERSVDAWDHIANDIRAAIAETGKGEFSNVLDLSYNNLPNHLKPCFLYMGAFPEDYRIKGSRLIGLLVAEGFAESHGDRSLEEVAEDYMEALVERNLVMVTRKRSNGKALCYGMHDLLRDLCRRKGGEEKFVHVIKNEKSVEVATTLKRVRRVSVHASAVSSGTEDVDAMVFTRSLIICLGGDMSLGIVSSVLRVLRVLNVFDVAFKEFPVEVLQLVNLRFLALSCSSKSRMPWGISRLLNLQTLIAQLQKGFVGNEVLEMSELRHLKLFGCMYVEEHYMKQNMQEKLKLQTLRGVICDRSVIRMGFFNTIPNIKNLGISMSGLMLESSEIVVDLSHLLKLKTLRCFSKNVWHYLPRLRFPPSLAKLTLFDSVIYARDWTTLCAVPNLEVLKICHCELENEVIELEPSEEDEYHVFRSLQYLRLEDLNNLVRWTADDTNFPRLRKLIVMDCPVLEEIPSGIGDISTLQRIQVSRCMPSVEASAKQIQEDQSENGNYSLKVVIYY